MPLLYMTPAEVLEHPLGVALASVLGTLQSGVLDKLLFRASKRCNTYCERRLQAPQATTVASPGATAGSVILPVISTLGIDNMEEYAVQVGSGGSLETIMLLAGGAAVTTFTAPYPGTLTLSTPLKYSHGVGEPVQGVYIETRPTGSSSQSDIYEDIVTQQAQIAAAHGGSSDFLNANRTRYHWLDEYPLISILGMKHAYPYTSEFQAVDVPSLLIEDPTRSLIKFPVGSFILAGGTLQTIYTAGYQMVPDEIKDAVIFYLKDAVVNFANPYGLLSSTMGKRSQSFQSGSGSPNIIEAQECLADYVR